MSFLGKLLVLITTLCSFVFLGLAAAVYLNSPNWAWDPKHARKEFGQPVPSELDKRKPIISELAQVKQRALAGWADSSSKLAKIEAEIPGWQLRYAEELTRIRTGETITLKALEEKKPWLFEKDAKTGKARFDFGEVEDSFAGYSRRLQRLLDSIVKKQAEVAAVIVDEKALTEELVGTVDGMGKPGKGLYALISLEEESRKRAQEELEDLRPSYYEELVLSQLLIKRQASLKARIEELKTTQKTTAQD